MYTYDGKDKNFSAKQLGDRFKEAFINFWHPLTITEIWDMSGKLK